MFVTTLSVVLAAGLIAQTSTSTPADSAAEEEFPFNDEQLDYLESLRDELRAEMQEVVPAGGQTGSPSVIEIKAEAYFKWLYRNNSRQGCVTYGNPHPRGDNFSGDNGQCPELGLTLIGRPTSKIEGGFRLQSRYGQDFSDWFENGDRRDVPDASSESLGQNHSAPVQLRGIYVRIAEPLPYIDWFLVGTSDLSYWDPWTLGKSRFIDRFNGKGLFIKGHVGPYLDVLLARVAMSKLFGTANYNSIEDALITNPFWTRDAVYAAKLSTPNKLIDGVSITLNGAVSLDEEADVRDPDAPGSVNVQDPQDEVTASAARFLGANASLTIDVSRFDFMRATALVAVSHNDPNPDYVTNLARGGLGFSNVVFDKTTDVAGTLRLVFDDVLGDGVSLKAEYFNIGSEFNAVAGARREADVLLTDGFMDGGQLPTLNLANELIDFSDAFYESIIGWHGATVILEAEKDIFDASLEATLLDYNTDAQDRDMDIYPGFGGFTGYTDDGLYSYANTNDRGRDPRTVYHRDQARSTFIFVGKGALKPDWWRGARIDAKAKLILDRDLRDDDFAEDDYTGTIIRTQASVSGEPLEALGLTLGIAYDYWKEDGRSGTYAGGVPNFVDYTTQRIRPFAKLRYSIGSVSAQYHIEALKKTIDASDPTQEFESGIIWRSIGSLGAQF